MQDRRISMTMETAIAMSLVVVAMFAILFLSKSSGISPSAEFNALLGMETAKPGLQPPYSTQEVGESAESDTTDSQRNLGAASPQSREETAKPGPPSSGRVDAQHGLGMTPPKGSGAVIRNPLYLAMLLAVDIIFVIAIIAYRRKKAAEELSLLREERASLEELYWKIDSYFGGKRR